MEIESQYELQERRHFVPDLSFMRVIFLIAVMFIWGCTPNEPRPTQKACSNLKSGMSKKTVRAIFSDFKVIGDDNKTYEISNMTTYFGTNKQSASSLQFMEDFSSKTHFFGEWAAVYFDTNEIIIAYHYHPPG